MLQRAKCSTIKKRQVDKVMVAKMHMLRWICELTFKERTGNDCIRGTFKVATIDNRSGNVV